LTPFETYGFRLAATVTGERCSDIWDVLSTARTIRRFTDEPVDDATLRPLSRGGVVGRTTSERSGVALHRVALARATRRSSPKWAAKALVEVIEPVYGMTRPADDDTSRARAQQPRDLRTARPRRRAHLGVVLHVRLRDGPPSCCSADRIYPAMQNFLLAARAQGLGACITSWASYGGEAILREKVGIPEEWLLAGHVVVGWPRGHHGPMRRRPLGDVVDLDHFDAPAVALAANAHPAPTSNVLKFRGTLKT